MSNEAPRRSIFSISIFGLTLSLRKENHPSPSATPNEVRMLENRNPYPKGIESKLLKIEQDVQILVFEDCKRSLKEGRAKLPRKNITVYLDGVQGLRSAHAEASILKGYDIRILNEEVLEQLESMSCAYPLPDDVRSARHDTHFQTPQPSRGQEVATGRLDKAGSDQPPKRQEDLMEETTSESQ